MNKIKIPKNLTAEIDGIENLYSIIIGGFEFSKKFKTPYLGYNKLRIYKRKKNK